jgi:hypothetical protein
MASKLDFPQPPASSVTLSLLAHSFTRTQVRDEVQEGFGHQTPLSDRGALPNKDNSMVDYLQHADSFY